MVRSYGLQFGRRRGLGYLNQGRTTNLRLEILEETAQIKLADAANGIKVSGAAIVFRQVAAQALVDIGARMEEVKSCEPMMR